VIYRQSHDSLTGPVSKACRPAARSAPNDAAQQRWRLRDLEPLDQLMPWQVAIPLLSLARPAGGGALEVAVGELQEGRPVRAGRVAAAVLAEGHGAVDQRGLLRWELGGSQVFLTQN